MEILSHRGFWNVPSEQNTAEAFARSFDISCGLETDVRDYAGNLVISHDLPTTPGFLLEDFFRLYKRSGRNLPLALNVKSDGLSVKLKELVEKFEVTNYFVFDMSIPDMRGYLAQRMPVFTRISDVETIPAYYSQAVGVWIDELEEPWIQWANIEKILGENKKVCIVSPELHRRKYQESWQNYLNGIQGGSFEGLMLCTDFPNLALEYFSNDN